MIFTPLITIKFGVPNVVILILGIHKFLMSGMLSNKKGGQSGIGYLMGTWMDSSKPSQAGSDNGKGRKNEICSPCDEAETQARV